MLALLAGRPLSRLHSLLPYRCRKRIAPDWRARCSASTTVAGKVNCRCSPGVLRPSAVTATGTCGVLSRHDVWGPASRGSPSFGSLPRPGGFGLCHRSVKETRGPVGQTEAGQVWAKPLETHLADSTRAIHDQACPPSSALPRGCGMGSPRVDSGG